MRIIGTIPHPGFKISAFKNENKFIIKVEAGPFEQSYKFLESDEIHSFESLLKQWTKLQDTELIRVFDQMNYNYKIINEH